MTSQEAGPHQEVLGLLGRQADHRGAERALLAAGWTRCGAGDWAIALRSTDPDRVVALIPQAERRFMTEIPLAVSGPWQPGAREAMRAGLAAADARKAGA